MPHEASLDKRNAAADAISSARPKRRSACSSTIPARGSSIPGPKTIAVIGVSMKPGQMALARIPLGP